MPAPLLTVNKTLKEQGEDPLFFLPSFAKWGTELLWVRLSRWWLRFLQNGVPGGCKCCLHFYSLLFIFSGGWGLFFFFSFLSFLSLFLFFSFISFHSFFLIIPLPPPPFTMSATAVAAPQGSVATTLLTAYLTELAANPLRTKALTSGTLSGLQEITATKLSGMPKSKNPDDFIFGINKRVVQMALYGKLTNHHTLQCHFNGKKKHLSISRENEIEKKTTIVERTGTDVRPDRKENKDLREPDHEQQTQTLALFFGWPLTSHGQPTTTDNGQPASTI